MASPRLGISTPLPADADNVPGALADLVAALEPFTWARFADAAERDAKIPAPTRMDACLLGSPGVGQVYTGTAWRTVFPPQILTTRDRYTQGAAAPRVGAGNLDLATPRTFARTEPYQVRATASIYCKVVGTGPLFARMTIDQSGAIGDVTRDKAELYPISVGNPFNTGHCAAVVVMPTGGTVAVAARLVVDADCTVTVYDDWHSTVEMTVEPYGTAF